ncbi:hypothetical protein CHS0354_023518 [Potamilus streckersoni]|uniref:VWFC domain-containing protein n=1 Tax=Potamilus streckersoni TaxID=2493646 RepID=A0AAE0RVC6_9BIVA|nr:hypothetical protein CHS0354_023518 [Potamilus streckersoni]
MGAYLAKNCLTLFLAMLPVFCRGLSTPGCFGTDRNFYNTGDPMPSTNPCDVDCICKDTGTILCSVMDCAMPFCVNPIRMEGKCCPVCSCEQDGVVYNPGQIVNHDPCNPCTCQNNGQITCENIECRNITCRYHVVPNNECCPVCQCMWGYKRFIADEIVKNVTCKPLVCQSDGSIKAKPVKCPDLQLQCVDPVFPEGSCCPECKNESLLTSSQGSLNRYDLGKPAHTGTTLFSTEKIEWLGIKYVVVEEIRGFLMHSVPI